MSIRPIESAADLAAIEAQGFDAYLPCANVLHAIEAQAERHPDRAALTYVVSDDLAEPALTWTYPEFAATIRRTGRLFQQLAGAERPRVAFLLPAIPQAHFTLWGAEAVGVACPINYLLSEEHVAELLRAAQVNVLVALGPHEQLDIWPRVAGIRACCPGLKHVVAVGGAGLADAIDFDSAIAAQSDAPLASTPGLDDVAALFHTGGTTGSPKLAQHLHRNQLTAAAGAACMYGATERDTIVNGFPLFHVAGAFVYALSMFLVGANVVLPTLLGLRNAGFVKRYWAFAERERATLLAAVPTVMSTLMSTPVNGADIARIRCLLTGGSPLPPDLADAFEQQLGLPVRNILGMTECGGVIAIEPCALPRQPGSVGLPIPFVQVRAVDADGQALGVGQDGELQISGPNVSPGYTDASKNAGVFQDDGWLGSGDIGHVDAQGRVYVTGRAKDMIIRSSHNIDPVLIEDALYRHPGVAMAAAVGAPDEYAGELPVAYVTLKPGATVSVDELLAFARAEVPEPPAVPKQIHVLDALPVTAIGKFYKPRLRELAVQQVIDARLAQRQLRDAVAFEVRSDHKGVAVSFDCGRDAAAASQVREMMRAFALRWQIVAPTGTGAQP